MFANVPTELKSIVQKIDEARPNIAQIDWSMFDQILHNNDFSACKNSLEALKLFYTILWQQILFPWKDELHIKDREVGRLIIEWDQERRLHQKFEKELEEAREMLQKAHPQALGETPVNP